MNDDVNISVNVEEIVEDCAARIASLTRENILLKATVNSLRRQPKDNEATATDS